MATIITLGTAQKVFTLAAERFDEAWLRPVQACEWQEMVDYKWVTKSIPAGYIVDVRRDGAGHTLETGEIVKLLPGINETDLVPYTRRDYEPHIAHVNRVPRES